MRFSGLSVRVDLVGRPQTNAQRCSQGECLWQIGSPRPDEEPVTEVLVEGEIWDTFWDTLCAEGAPNTTFAPSKSLCEVGEGMIPRDYFALKERCIYAFLSRCACSQNFIAAHSAGSAPPKLEYQAAHPRKLRKRRRKAHKELAGRCTSAFKKDRMSVLNLSADPISSIDRCQNLQQQLASTAGSLTGIPCSLLVFSPELLFELQRFIVVLGGDPSRFDVIDHSVCSE